MFVSAMLTSLPLDFSAALRQAAALGFTHVDIVALTDRPLEHLEALADSGLLVSCAPGSADEVLTIFRREGFARAAVIGEMRAGAPRVTVA